MNEKQPYEKHLGEKLQQLAPPGDANRSWEQMRSLLDRELPGRNGRGGGGRWWTMGIIVFVLLSGTWFAIKQYGKTAGHQSSVKAVQDSPSKETSPSSGVSLPSDNGATDKSVATTPRSNDGKTNTPATESSVNTKTANADLPDEKEKTEVSKRDEAARTTQKNKADVKNLPVAKKDIATSSAQKVNTSKDIDQGATLKPNEKAVPNPDEEFAANSTQRGRPRKTTIENKVAEGNTTGITGDKRTGRKNDVHSLRDNLGENILNASPVAVNTTDAAWREANPSLLAEQPLQRDYTPLNLPAAIDKNIAKNNRRYKKPVVHNKSASPRVVGTGEDKNFVIGLSLPLAFPLADQKATAYNFNAGANTVSDYLPVPHFQYHFNDKSYLQSEIQVISPQYIQSVLLFQTMKELPQGTTSYRFVTNSVYARKLYYFNLPVAVHYSPFKHFYLGTGLQFSSLISGIALYEQRGYNAPTISAPDSLYSQQYLKFRNDSVSGRLNGSEFRLLLDANYYWKRFTVGLRYNQALSNYVALRVNPTSNYFEDKNKSLQFYLRYNLWEDRKRKNPSKGLTVR